ncbi:unnamed protein product [Pleuronectes platessa]|uniref:Uncharacterized protein n=1 Tax=Pleuronectes platessa TaxID=8262 RepID=A0A9N7YQU0_PLEPL|nr:unnamed protein product [Pleuronectes platessa]
MRLLLADCPHVLHCPSSSLRTGKAQSQHPISFSLFRPKPPVKFAAQMIANIVKWGARRSFRSQTPDELRSPWWDINRGEERDMETHTPRRDEGGK